MDMYELHSDPYDRRLIRLNNMLQCLSAICDLAALCDPEMKEYSDALDLCSECSYFSMQGCMVVQTHIELKVGPVSELPFVVLLAPLPPPPRAPRLFASLRQRWRLSRLGRSGAVRWSRWPTPRWVRSGPRPRQRRPPPRPPGPGAPRAPRATPKSRGMPPMPRAFPSPSRWSADLPVRPCGGADWFIFMFL